MGMRATIAYISEDKTVSLTSLQWSTRLDQTLGHMASSARQSGKSPISTIANLFKTVTSNWQHLSAIELNFEANTSDEPGTTLLQDMEGSRQDFHFGHRVQVCAPQGVNNKTHNLKNIDIYKYHLDSGSIGAIYNERNPHYIEFFWMNPNTRNIETRKCSINSLANFYKEAKNNPDKVKTFSFRNF